MHDLDLLLDTIESYGTSIVDLAEEWRLNEAEDIAYNKDNRDIDSTAKRHDHLLLEEEVKQLKERCEVLQSKEKQLVKAFARAIVAIEDDKKVAEERCHAMELKDKEVDVRCEALELEKKRLSNEMELKEKQIDIRCKGLEIKEKEVLKRFESLELKQKQVDKSHKELEIYAERVYQLRRLIFVAAICLLFIGFLQLVLQYAR